MEDERTIQVYKIELMFIDHDGLGEWGVRDLIEHTRYPNHVSAPAVKTVEVRAVQWTDGHPLNNSKTSDAAYQALFEEKKPGIYKSRTVPKAEALVLCEILIPLEPVPQRALQLGVNGLTALGKSNDPSKRGQVSNLLRQRGVSPTIYLGWNVEKRIDVLMRTQLTEVLVQQEFGEDDIPDGWDVV